MAAVLLKSYAFGLRISGVFLFMKQGIFLLVIIRLALDVDNPWTCFSDIMICIPVFMYDKRYKFITQTAQFYSWPNFYLHISLQLILWVVQFEVWFWIPLWHCIWAFRARYYSIYICTVHNSVLAELGRQLSILSIFQQIASFVHVLFATGTVLYLIIL